MAAVTQRRFGYCPWVCVFLSRCDWNLKNRVVFVPIAEIAACDEHVHQQNTHRTSRGSGLTRHSLFPRLRTLPCGNVSRDFGSPILNLNKCGRRIPNSLRAGFLFTWGPTTTTQEPPSHVPRHVHEQQSKQTDERTLNHRTKTPPTANRMGFRSLK